MSHKFYDLTNPQKSIYYTEEYYPATNINNISGIIAIHQKVDVNKLILSIKQVIKQNDSCRIMLRKEGESVKQWIEPYQDFSLEVAEVASEQELISLAQKIAAEPFTLYQSYLFKFVVYRTPNGHGGFIIKMHHIIADSWTLGITINEIIKIYATYLSEETPALKDSSTYSYTQYITSEQEYQKSTKYEKDKAYWENVFSTIPDIATIPSTGKDDNEKTSNDAFRKDFHISSALFEKIKNYCSEQKISVFNFFTAVFSIYMSRVSNLEDFCIGTPILNRSNFKEKNTGRYVY